MLSVVHLGGGGGFAAVLRDRMPSCTFRIIIQGAASDYGGINRHYGVRPIRGTWKVSAVRALWACRSADIVHVHDTPDIIPHLRKLYGRKSPTVALHYHGPHVRANPPERRRRIESMANIILVSTPDLLKHGYASRPVWIPNPIDTELFRPARNIRNGRGFVFAKAGQTVRWTMDRLNELGVCDGIEWTVRTRAESYIPYPNMPDTLAGYEYYADAMNVNGELGTAPSTTALQALAVGLNVISWDGTQYASLPERHLPCNVAQRLGGVYRALAARGATPPHA